MASKIRVFLEREGHRYTNNHAFRWLEARAYDYGLKVPDEKMPRWKKAQWIFEHITMNYSRLVMYRERRGHRGQWTQVAQSYGIRRRVQAPPARRNRNARRLGMTAATPRGGMLNASTSSRPTQPATSRR